MASRRRVVSTMPKKYFPKACGCLTSIYINFKLSAQFNKLIYPLLFILVMSPKEEDAVKGPEKMLLSWRSNLHLEGSENRQEQPPVNPQYPWVNIFSKHLLRYWPFFAWCSTLHFAGAVNTRQKITVPIINLVYSEFPNRSYRSVRSFIGTLNCT